MITALDLIRRKSTGQTCSVFVETSEIAASVDSDISATCTLILKNGVSFELDRPADQIADTLNRRLDKNRGH